MNIYWISNQKVIIGIRILTSIIILIYGWWIVASFRTQTFGTEGVFKHIFAAAIFVLPFSIVPFIGLRPAILIKYSFSLFTVIIFASLVWGSFEEFVVTQDTPITDNETVVIKRWWPFEHHVIVHSPDAGWYADD